MDLVTLADVRAARGFAKTDTREINLAACRGRARQGWRRPEGCVDRAADGTDVGKRRAPAEI